MTACAVLLLLYNIIITHLKISWHIREINVIILQPVVKSFLMSEWVISTVFSGVSRGGPQGAYPPPPI